MAKAASKTSVKAKAKANPVKAKRVRNKDSETSHNDNRSSKRNDKNSSSEPTTKKTVVNKPLDTQSKTISSKSTLSKRKASNWFLYMLECADGRVYTGITTDVERRFAEHSSSGPKAAKALRGKGPLKLVFQQPMDNRSEASIAESAIKKLSKSDKRLLIQSGLFDRDS